MWDNSINKIGKNPVVIIGAGFTLGVLCNPPLTTKDIIPKTIESNDKGWFPILSYLYREVPEEALTLNNIWTNIRDYSILAEKYKYQIYENYLSLGRPVLVNYFENRLNYNNFIEAMLGIEIKRLIALHMTSESMKGKRKKLISLKKMLIKNADISNIQWISLNYDTCLEELIDSCNEKWVYTFLNERYKHIIIKPHGSLNIAFKTDWGISPIKHSIAFYSEEDQLRTFYEREIGISNQLGISCEKRPWIVGYLPDSMKHEHSTKVYESDIAHDLCRLNVGAFSMALQSASSLFILGYSMPMEDRWVWNKTRMLTELKLPVFIMSEKDSERIKEQFHKYGYINSEVLNNGEIDG